MAGVIDRFKGLFAKGSTASDRKASAYLDNYGPDTGFPDGCLAALWELHYNRTPLTTRYIEQARDAMHGGISGAVAETWDAQEREAFRTGTPDAWTRPRDTAKKIGSAKKSRIKRPLTKLGPDAQRDSTRIEQWDNALLDDQFPDFEATEMALNEGPSLFILAPTPAHWRKIETLYDEWEEEGPFLKSNAYDAMPETKRREYERANPSEKDADPTYKRIRSRYRRDAKGQKDAGDGFEIDLKKTGKEFREAFEDHLARNVPIVIRGPISRLDFVPLDPTFSGKQTKVQGVIIRTLFRKSKLKQSYRWEGCDDLIEPTGPDGRDGDFYLYELWAYDEDDRPYVCYQVGSHGTHWADDGTTAVIRLDERFPGVTELPISFEYGDHTATSDPDKRSLPFAIPFIDNWRQRNGILDAFVMSVQTYGYPSFIQELTPDSLKVLAELGGDVDLEFRVQPNTVKPSVGKIVPLTPTGAGPDVAVLYSMLRDLNETELPQPGAFGGEGPSSGLERSIQGKDLEVRFGPVIESVRRHKEAMGRHGLMVGSALGRLIDRPVELYQIGTAPNPETGGTSTTRTKLTLPPDICDGNWDVVAQFETRPGENLAQSAHFLAALDAGAILLREYREWAVGDENPEQFLWEKMLEDYYLKTEAGRLDILTGMAEYVSETRIKQMLQLAEQQKVTSAQGGMATSAMTDLLGGGQPMALPAGGWGYSGPGSGDPGASAVGGAAAGAYQASAAAAGSPMSGALVAG